MLHTESPGSCNTLLESETVFSDPSHTADGMDIKQTCNMSPLYVKAVFFNPRCTGPKGKT